jgi:hypothetical protein
MSDFLDDRRHEITDRLKELKPVVDEFNRLEAAAEALAGAVGSAASEAASVAVATVTRRRKRGRRRGSRKAASANTPPPKVARKEPARPKGSGKKPGRPADSGKKVGRPAGKVGRPKGRGGRPKGGGKRATEALSLVRGQPGITIPELAAKMGIKQNYLYRVLPGLEKDGKLEKKGRGYHPKQA